jgi:hypothetical protein
MNILNLGALLAGIAILLFSRNKKHYNSLVKENGEDFARSNINKLKLGGYSLIVCAVLWILMNYL